MTLGEKLKRARQQKELTQKQLEKRSGIPFLSISRYERDANKPDIDSLRTLASALDVSIAYLLGEENQNTLFKNPNPRYAPLLGTASAGTPETPDEFVGEVLEIPGFIKYDPTQLFFIQISGDSMNKILPHGMKALILKAEHFTSAPKTGEIVVFKADNEFCVKRFIETDTVVIFEPSSFSSEFKPLVYVKGTNIDIEIIGKVVYAFNYWK